MTLSAEKKWQKREGGGGARADSQALHHTERAQAKVGTEDRKKPFEKFLRPPKLREDERADLEDDQKPIEDGPKLASGLIGNRAVAKKKGEVEP
jgi:hypothetical protein